MGQVRKRARFSPIAASEYPTPARPKIVAVVPATGNKIPTVRGSKKYDHDPNLQPVPPMTPFLADLAHFNWTAVKTPGRSSLGGTPGRMLMQPTKLQSTRVRTKICIYTHTHKQL